MSVDENVQEQGGLGHIGLVELSGRHVAALGREDTREVKVNGARRRKDERVGRRSRGGGIKTSARRPAVRLLVK